MVKKSIKKAKTIPSKLYFDDEQFAKLRESIFIKNWQFVGDKTQINNDGDAIPYEFMEGYIPEPLIIVNNNKKIQSFSNVCTHRGNILLEKPKNIKNGLVCRYHGRQFNSCGKFKFMPMFQNVENFPSNDDNLKIIPTETWKQFVFSSINPSVSFKSLINDMDQRIGWMPIEKFVFSKSRSKEYIVNANWALYCDNYLEGFHIPFVHKGLAQNLNYSEYNTEIFPFSNLQIGVGKENDICFELPKESTDYGKKIAAYYFWLFPNIMFNFYPWGLSINIIKPMKPEQTKVKFLSYIWDESKLNFGAGAELDKVEKKDEAIEEQVQKGVKSRFYDRGKFSPSMETGVHHFHLLLSQFMQN